MAVTTTVDLSGLEDFLAVVVIAQTGVVYGNQVGGLTCRHAEAQGYLVPLAENFVLPVSPDAGAATDVDLFFADAFADRGGLGEITHEKALDLDRIFARWGLPIRVNRDRLADSQEAWLFVHLTSNGEDGPLRRVPDLGPVPGILTWENSD